MAIAKPLGLSWADPVYDQSLSNAWTKYSNTTAGLTRDRNDTAKEYGYTPTYDANGYVQSLAQDPNDPYAKANLLTRSYREGMARNRNSFAARGQLYAGALNVAQDETTRNYDINSHNLQDAFIKFIASNQGAMDTAAGNYNNDLTTAYGEALGRYTPPAPETPKAPAPSYAAGTATPTGAPAPDWGVISRGLGIGGTATLSDGTVVRKASNGNLQVKNKNGTWRNLKVRPGE